jgi:hypothetical protein
MKNLGQENVPNARGNDAGEEKEKNGEHVIKKPSRRGS